MIRASRTHRLLVLALFILAFVVVPVAEAAICAFDGEASHAVILPDGDGTDDYGDPFDSLAGHCEHGHCHHATSHVAAPVAETRPAVRPVYRWPDDGPVVSHTPDRLKRPPRA